MQVWLGMPYTLAHGSRGLIRDFRGIKSHDMHRVSARRLELPSSLHHVDSDTVQSNHVPYAPLKGSDRCVFACVIVPVLIDL